jgi:hypothetical protein
MPRELLPTWILAVGVVALVAVLAASPAAAVGRERLEGTGRVVAAAPPVESCSPGDLSSTGGFTVCRDEPGGGGAGGLLSLLPIVVVVVIAGIAVLLGAFLVLERRNRRQLAPVDPGDWWTCRNCGRTNVVGSPRCYACGTWQA